MDVLGRILTGIFAAILIFLLPLQYLTESYEFMNHEHVTASTREFTDTICQNGFLTMDIYRDFLNEIDNRGTAYQLEMEVAHPVLGTELGHKEEQGSVYFVNGFTSEHDELSYRSALENSSFLNTKALTLARNISLGGGYIQDVSSAIEHGLQTKINSTGYIPAATHTHTDDCYDGEKHIHSGNSKTGGGCYGNYNFRRCTGKIKVTYLSRSPTRTFVCDIYDDQTMCGKEIEEYTEYYSITCTVCGTRTEEWVHYQSNYCGGHYYTNIPIWVHYPNDCYEVYSYDLNCELTEGTYYTYIDSSIHTHQGSVSTGGECYSESYNKICASCEKKIVSESSYGNYYQGWTTIYYCADGHSSSKPRFVYQLICSKAEKKQEAIDPICNTVVTSITAIKPIQTVIEGESIIVTATATYLDGHTATIACTNDYKVATGTKTVTLTYGGLVGNARTTGIRTCTTIVTTLPRTRNITFMSNGGSGTMSVQAVNYNTTTPLKTNEFTRSYYTFSKWNTKSDGSGISYTNGAPITITEDLTLYAIWTSSTIVTSIIPTLSTQTVYKGSNIITTATATYLDGHIGTVSCSSNYSGKIGTEIVTITYSGIVGTVNGAAMGTRTCTMIVNTKPNIASIMVSLSSNIVYHGSEPTYTVKAIYEDKTEKFIGEGYTKEGFTKGAGKKNVTFTYTENGRTASLTIIITVLRNTKLCPNGHLYELDDYDVDYGCTFCEKVIQSIQTNPMQVRVNIGDELSSYVSVYGTFLSGTTTLLTDWTSNFSPEEVGMQYVKIEYGGCFTYIMVMVEDWIACNICGTRYELLENEKDSGCPTCKSQIVSISADPTYISVNFGEDFTTVVMVTYQDGHTTSVTGWISDFNPMMIGLQKVTIVYESYSTEVVVEVKAQGIITCPICSTEYDTIINPHGCPVCSVTIDFLEAYLKSGKSSIVLGSELSLYVVVVYKDGHRELIESGWTVDGYDFFKVGEQRIVITYRSHSTVVPLKVVSAIDTIVCPYGHRYYTDDDGTDVGCPYCEITLDEQGIAYITMIFTEDIVEEMETNNIFYFDEGDYITVRIYKNDGLNINKLKVLLYLSQYETKNIVTVTGGVIL